jgi:hypothetical protein
MSIWLLTLHCEIFHLSSSNFGAVSAPGVPVAGVARGGWPAREKGGKFEALSLEYSWINKQKILSLNHVKLSPKSKES